MKRKFLLCIILFIACFLNVSSVKASFNAGDCIKGFGSIRYVTSNNNSTSSLGKVEFSNQQNVETWSAANKSFDVELTSMKGYKIKEIIYYISSKDGYSCSGTISGTNIQNTYAKVSVLINGNRWVEDISFYANMKEDNSEKTHFTPKKTQKVKYNKAVTTTFKQDESMTCQFLEDVFGEYWTWVLVLAPTLAVILITLDFVGCLLSSDAEAMKKAGDKALKRSIALVLLLMLPIILKLIFNLFGLDICGV